MGAIRLFLAFAVLMEHFDQQVLTQIGLQFDLALTLFLNGGRAVLLFYVISGFLISYVLHEKYSPDRRGILAFYRSRFLRIFPLWWCILLLAIFLHHWRGSSDPFPSNLVPATALFGLDWIIPLRNFPGFDWSVLPPRTAVAWTLGAEVTFYLFAPFLLRSPRFALAILIGSAGIRAVILLTISRGAPGFTNLTMFFFPATMICFMLGHFGAVLYRFRPIGAAGSLVLLCISLALCYHAENHVTFDDWLANLLPVCFALALPGIFAATKDSRFFNFLGDLTYPLYLIHSLAFVAFWPLKERLSPWLLQSIQARAALQTILLGVLLAFAGAIAVRYLIEPVARYAASKVIDTATRPEVLSALRARLSKFDQNSGQSDSLRSLRETAES